MSFGGVVVELFSAPARGDASMIGNVFGFTAMVLWVCYVSSTRHFRGDIDVATFMATISPIAAVAVLPLAIANGGVFGMSSTGWTYMLILTLLIGVAGHGLMVFAQKTIAIGTIGVSSVIQPALAVVWSYLLLSEAVRGWQVVGITVAIVGLGAFLVLSGRGERSRHAEELLQPPLVGEDPDAKGPVPGVRPVA